MRSTNKLQLKVIFNLGNYKGRAETVKCLEGSLKTIFRHFLIKGNKIGHGRTIKGGLEYYDGVKDEQSYCAPPILLLNYQLAP